MCDEGVNLNSFFVRRFFLRFPLKASTYVAERCNTRNKKNETSSQKAVFDIHHLSFRKIGGLLGIRMKKNAFFFFFFFNKHYLCHCLRMMSDDRH